MANPNPIGAPLSVVQKGDSVSVIGPDGLVFTLTFEAAFALGRSLLEAVGGKAPETYQKSLG